MISRTTKNFRRLLRASPRELRIQARKAFERFRENPGHPSLRFKKVAHPSLPLWSVRVGLGWRAVGLRTDDGVTWFWIGEHDDYEKLLAQL